MIIHKSYYNDIFKPLRGKKILLCLPYGNVGDQLIWHSTYQLFKYNNIQHETIKNQKNISSIINSKDISIYDSVLWVGGGNMGMLYKPNYEYRKQISNKCIKYKIPFIILPQTWTSYDDTIANKYYARDYVSISSYAKKAVFAHDLALSYDLEYDVKKMLCPTSKKYSIGYFFRSDIEQIEFKQQISNNRDPAKICKSYKEYLTLASMYNEIHTNRLHFAICGLIVESNIKFYANSYFKNKAIYDCSLKHLPNIEWVEK